MIIEEISQIWNILGDSLITFFEKKKGQHMCGQLNLNQVKQIVQKIGILEYVEITLLSIPPREEHAEL